MSSRSPQARRYGVLLRVHLSFAQQAELRRWAREHDQSLSAVVREALARTLGIAAEADSSPALAALVAAEHALKLLETIVPGGSARSAQLRELAVAAAEARLASLRRELAGEES
ncbi:MAG TPA: hypothetical protein VK131_02075 [Candidatus Acidoferrales bacterium]|nr:hypothetical protein [Candidatus Acidoferrales bacterium]